MIPLWTDDEVYLVAVRGHSLFLQGRYAESAAIFEGLHAVRPRDFYCEAEQHEVPRKWRRTSCCSASRLLLRKCARCSVHSIGSNRKSHRYSERGPFQPARS